MSGFTSPNYTQTPNDLFDVLLADMGEAELRVVLVAIRLTLGYHKRYDAISYTRFEQMTGMSRQGVISGVQSAIEHGLLREVGEGKRGVKLYELVIVVDQSTTLTSQGADQSTALTSTSQRSRHTKESTSNKKDKKKGVRTPSKKYQQEDTLIDIWADVRGFRGKDIGADYHSATDRRAAKRMLGWERPPTADEIQLVMKVSKSSNYAFPWLEKDITELRLERAKNPQPVRRETTSAPANDDSDPISPEQAEEANQIFKRLVEARSGNTRPR